MSHLRAFVANQVCREYAFFWVCFCPDFYSDIEDFTQILCRYLPKKLVAKTSGAYNMTCFNLNFGLGCIRFGPGGPDIDQKWPKLLQNGPKSSFVGFDGLN